MTTYRFQQRLIDVDAPEFEPALAEAHARRERPLCTCAAAGVEMYIAKVAGKYIIKRMPNTGFQHLTSCDSYDPPPELSGLGQVMGSAIDENVDDGYVALKLGYSLSKGGTRAAPPGAPNDSDSVKTDGSKLTLRGTLHYLWEEAGFNRWTPGMEGRRNWFVLRKYLQQATLDKRAKGALLADVIYIPETFSAMEKDAIAQRRTAQFARIAGSHKSGRRLMIVIAEVKEIARSRYGHKIVAKHVPDSAFMLNEDIHKRLLKRFNVELGLWDSANDIHLLMIGTFGVGISGVANLEEVALMTVNENWIPVESLYDKALIDQLIREKRRFTKGLRYNLSASHPLASAVLSDTEPLPTALYLVPPEATDEFESTIEALVSDSHLAAWIWRSGDAPTPVLPAAAPSHPSFKNAI